MVLFVAWTLWITLWICFAIVVNILLMRVLKTFNLKVIVAVFVTLIMGVFCIRLGSSMFLTESQIEEKAKIERQRIDDIVTSQLNSAGYNGSEIRSWLSIDYVSQEGDKVTIKHYGDIDTIAMEKLNKIVSNQKEKGEIEDYFIEREQRLVGPQKNRSLITDVVILITLKKE